MAKVYLCNKVNLGHKVNELRWALIFSGNEFFENKELSLKNEISRFDLSLI